MHRGCAGQTLDSSGFSGPVPWVGLYAAAASAICALAMASDAAFAIRRRQLWFPSSLFSLNATTITVLSVATKLPLDLTSPMPSRFDQLAKLSGSALVATAAANLFPSLVSSSSSDLIALAIVIVTLIGNVAIQIATGIIYAFVAEHIAILVLTLALLLLLCSSTLAVPITKRELEEQFEKKFKQADSSDRGNNFDVASLKESVNRYWLMAHTSSPQYVIGRSATCTASGAFGLLASLTLMEAAVRSVFGGHHNRVSLFCEGVSDYKWSTTIVFFSQAVAVAVGTVAPAWRWLNALSFRGHLNGSWSCRDGIRAEKYWIQMLLDLKENAFFMIPLHGSRRCRKMAHDLRNRILDTIAAAQTGVVMACMVLRLASVLPVSWIYGRCNTRLVSMPSSSTSSAGSSRAQSGLEVTSIVVLHLERVEDFDFVELMMRTERGAGWSRAQSGLEMSSFVLHLEWEEDLVELMRTERRHTEQWIGKGARHKPAHLIQLLDQCRSPMQGFREFAADSVPSLTQDEPPNCWALPLVTLTAIAVSLPNTQLEFVKSLRRGVSEGLKYVRLIEKHLDGQGLTAMSRAAEVVWLGIDLNDKWLDEGFHDLVAGGNSCLMVIENLERVSRECVTEYKTRRDYRNNQREWPAKELASNCMYRVSWTILQKYRDNHMTDDNLFSWLRGTIADILCACLTNLPRIIPMECICSSIQLREKKVRDTAFLLGETETIIEMLGDPAKVSSYPENRECIDNWRMARQNRNPTSPSTSS